MEYGSFDGGIVLHLYRSTFDTMKLHLLFHIQGLNFLAVLGNFFLLFPNEE